MSSIAARLIPVLAAMTLLAACTSTAVMETTNEVAPLEGDAVILLVEPDVELSFLKAAGVSEVRADWTETGKANVLAEIETLLATRGHKLVEHEIDPENEREVQIVKLHEIVGATILSHRFMGQPLPSKRGKFDWSLGPGVRDMAEAQGADYALFLHARGEYASSGRQAVAIGLAVLGAGGVSTGGQGAYASLVDMRTGDIIWFNVAFTGPGTDMREQDGAEHLVSAILKDIPL
ncbi:hypothetical protein FF098_006440 [Parvularcula flava]|uniref:Lipoprotein n=1 Tax=Aquisalinus luteolus TaxID=1566827 RepID=A0A8J3EPA1_9PROT|nr:hypothetical protein [Aquisalinus luteolus]NHK27537.1 hypothetical protein [Aquisalinus luteolus]GGH95736.1 hypothetical protein GCM10011355_12980 [Aquisalinus luteolus]